MVRIATLPCHSVVQAVSRHLLLLSAGSFSVRLFPRHRLIAFPTGVPFIAFRSHHHLALLLPQ